MSCRVQAFFSGCVWRTASRLRSGAARTDVAAVDAAGLPLPRAARPTSAAGRPAEIAVGKRSPANGCTSAGQRASRTPSGASGAERPAAADALYPGQWPGRVAVLPPKDCSGCRLPGGPSGLAPPSLVGTGSRRAPAPAASPPLSNELWPEAVGQGTAEESALKARPHQTARTGRPKCSTRRLADQARFRREALGLTAGRPPAPTPGHPAAPTARHRLQDAPTPQSGNRADRKSTIGTQAASCRPPNNSNNNNNGDDHHHHHHHHHHKKPPPPCRHPSLKATPQKYILLPGD